MRRRALLAAVAASVSLAGCSGRGGSGTGDDTTTGAGTTGTTRRTTAGSTASGPDATVDSTTGEPTTTTGDGDPSTTATPDDRPPIAERGHPDDICSRTVIDDFPIRAIEATAYADDWDGVEVDPRYHHGGQRSGDPLAPETVVIGVERGGRARAYPMPVVWWHEIVNDDLGGPLVVTFCPLCNSGMVAEAVVGGEPATFDVSGHLWDPRDEEAQASVDAGRTFAATRNDPNAEHRFAGNLVMYDLATGTFWSQLIAEAICGPHAGDRLAIVPSSVTTWDEWRADHPDTDVLLPPPHSRVL